MTKKRNIGQELLDGVRAIKRGKGKRVAVNLPKDVRAIRKKVGLSQSAFAAVARGEHAHATGVGTGPAHADRPGLFAATRGRAPPQGAAGLMYPKERRKMMQLVGLSGCHCVGREVDGDAAQGVVFQVSNRLARGEGEGNRMKAALITCQTNRKRHLMNLKELAFVLSVFLLAGCAHEK